MTTTLRLFSLAIIAMLFAGCAGMTAAESSGAIAGVGGVLVALAEGFSPLLSPENQGKVIEFAQTAEGLFNAAKTVSGAVAERMVTLEEAQAASWDTQDIAIATGGGSGVALGVSRVLSAIKHRAKPVATVPVSLP